VTGRAPALARKSAPPRPRAGVYDLYWIFAAKRQAAYLKRLSGAAAPWSSDPAIEEWKFCCTYRAADRISQYAIAQVCNGPGAIGGAADRLLRIVAFRIFSKNETWEGIRAALGRELVVGDLVDGGALDKALDATLARTGGLFTGAFILCANKTYGFDQKHKNYRALLHAMFDGGFAKRALGANSLEALVGEIQSWPMFGPFMAYQIAIDILYSDLTGHDEDDFTQAGPGAERGIAKCFEDIGDWNRADVIRFMANRQEDEFKRLDIDFPGLFGRRLHLIDCQGLFCETDKYCRIVRPELASNRSEMKARFKPRSEMARPWFSPKWGLNDAIEKAYPSRIMSFDRLF